MNQDQINSLTRTGLKIIGGILAAHGGQQMATLINTPDVVQFVSGLVVTGIAIYASHTTHAPTPPPVQPPKP
jgi:hypothetical protein